MMWSFKSSKGSLGSSFEDDTAANSSENTVSQGATAVSTSPPLDIEKVEAFGGRMLTLLNHGATTLMVSLGHKTGLFETMATFPAMTSQKLAEAACLNERYVREWLDAMYVSGIVEMSTPKSRRGGAKDEAPLYSLPAEKAAFLTWGRGPENVAVLSQYVSLLSKVEGKVLDCFRNGGGIPSSEFGELKAVMAADAAQTIASSLTKWIIPLGGRRLVDDLQAGIDVLDLQFNTGVNLLTMAKEYPRSWFTGYDTEPANVAMATKVSTSDSFQNVRFKNVDFLASSELCAYDIVTCFGSLAESGNPRAVLLRAYEALRRGGTLLVQDIAASSNARANRQHPAGPLMYAVSVLYTVPSSISKTGDDASAIGTMWGSDSALQLIREVGFQCDGPSLLKDDHCNAFFFCRRT